MIQQYRRDIAISISAFTNKFFYFTNESHTFLAKFNKIKPKTPTTGCLIVKYIK